MQTCKHDRIGFHSLNSYFCKNYWLLFSKSPISFMMSFFLDNFSFWSLSGFLTTPVLIFSSRVSISLNFFLKFFNRFPGSVVGELWDAVAVLEKLGSCISHLASFSAASSTPGKLTYGNSTFRSGFWPTKPCSWNMLVICNWNYVPEAIVLVAYPHSLT